MDNSPEDYSPRDASPGTNHPRTINWPDYSTAVLFTGSNFTGQLFIFN